MFQKLELKWNLLFAFFRSLKLYDFTNALCKLSEVGTQEVQWYKA